MKKRSCFVLDREPFDVVFPTEIRREIMTLTDLQGPPLTAAQASENPELLRNVELIFSGWMPPVMDQEFLDAVPHLEAVFYAAGSVKKFVTDALWQRGIVVTSAAAMNAIPVAELTLAHILLSLKRVWQHALSIRSNGRGGRLRLAVPGAYKSKVGLIALGEIGQLVCKHLRQFDIEILAYDPHVDSVVFEALGAQRVETLDELFATCDVVSLHAPRIPATVGMITGHHLSLMKDGATFINTARGDLVRETELVQVLCERPHIWAILDVLANDDRCVDPRIYTLSNVIITPHIAGSMGRECERMGAAMVSELKRYLDGQPLQWQVHPERCSVTA